MVTIRNNKHLRSKVLVVKPFAAIYCFIPHHRDMRRRAAEADNTQLEKQLSNLGEFLRQCKILFLRDELFHLLTQMQAIKELSGRRAEFPLSKISKMR
jgi:hypothetical protein